MGLEPTTSTLRVRVITTHCSTPPLVLYMHRVQSLHAIQCNNVIIRKSKESILQIPLVSDHRLLNSLVVQCWLQVPEVPGSIPSKGPRHTKDVIKMVPVVPLFSTEHSKGKILALSQELRQENNVMDIIWDRKSF